MKTKIIDLVRNNDVMCGACGTRLLVEVNNRHSIRVACPRCGREYVSFDTPFPNSVIETLTALKHNSHSYIKVLGYEICIYCGEWKDGH